MTLVEIQVDRLVGPTHHFGGLGVGNVASQQHAGSISNPAAAALQGLDKMRLVARCGASQIILPPQTRPDFRFLRSAGFHGTDADLLRRARDEAPVLLSAAMSCSAMWTANAATVTPAIDGDSACTMVTIANLNASVHRAIEPPQTLADLRRALPNSCRVELPIPGGAAMRDEGAANHIRLGSHDDRPGMNLFVYGDGQPEPRKFWPRQSRAACEAIARRHRLDPQNTFYLKQHPAAIDAGAFHNDVVALSHRGLLIHHELAFSGCEQEIQTLEQRFAEVMGTELIRIEVPSDALTIDDAVQTYLFNSQVISAAVDDTKPVLICPQQAAVHQQARRLVDDWCREGLFSDVHFVDLGESMFGGGGPACLRLRVPIAGSQDESSPPRQRWTEQLDVQLRQIIQESYLTQVSLDDLARVELADHAREAHRRIVDALCRPSL